MATNRDNIKFYLDVEATDLQRGNEEKVLSGSKIHKTAGRGSIPQLIQFYGQFSDDSKVLQTHTTLKVNDPDYYNKLELEFTYTPRGASESVTLNDEQIKKAMTQGGDLAKALQERRGEFSISKGSQEALKSLIVTNKTNPTAGMLPLSTMQTGSTMRKILASNVFESKYGKGKVRETEKFISGFLNTMERRTRNLAEGQKVEFRAWNVSYDLGIIAQNIDEFGTDTQKQQFKKLFGQRINDQAAPIKVVDEADKLKSLQFDLMLADEKYQTYHIDSRTVEDHLKKGTPRDVIRSTIAKNVKSNQSSTYLKKNQGLRSLADEVRASGNLSIAKLEAKFLDRVAGVDTGVLETDSVERKIVKTAAEMVHELANPQGERDSLEIIRRHFQDVNRNDRSRVTLNRIFKVADGSTGGVLGFAKDIDVHHAPDGSLHQSVLQFSNKMATGLDLQAGYSLGSGQGLLNQFVQAKETYGETIRTKHGGRSSELTALFESIDSIQRTSQSAGGLHDASVDVKNMINLTEKAFNRRLDGAADLREFMQITMKENAIESMNAKLDVYVEGKQIGASILNQLGVNMDGAPPGESQVDISRTVQNSSDTVGDAARSTMGRVQQAMQSRGGVLTKAALITSGLVLIGNMSGDIKSPVSRHNTLEGISPSGDTLLHSFGSGSDRYSNQAINNLKYNFNMGSETLRSSMLGYQGDRLYDMLLGRETFNDHTRSAEKGNIVHKIIEQEYMSKGLAQSREHYVYSSELDVVGHIDIILKSGVPLEIKSVEDFDALDRLKSPKEKHVSQANFYAYALKQPYAIIGYAARNDPSKVKYFKVNTNAKRVMDDVSAIRKASADLKRQGHDVVTYSAHKYMSDLYLQMTQTKYAQNAVGVGVAVAPGMLASPEDYSGYSAIQGLGDYSKHQKKQVWRQERRTNLTNTSQYKGKSKIRNQAKHADLHKNATLKYNQRQSGYHNRSRAMNYSGV